MTPAAVLVRQVLGAIAQFENASVVTKLAAARIRDRVDTRWRTLRRGQEPLIWLRIGLLVGEPARRLPGQLELSPALYGCYADRGVPAFGTPP
jgi:hypothetical protein